MSRHAHPHGREISAEPRVACCPRGSDYYTRSLALFRDLGDAYEEADTLDRLSRTHLALGQTARARSGWQQAFALCRAQGRTAEADRVQRDLAASGQGTTGTG